MKPAVTIACLALSLIAALPRPQIFSLALSPDGKYVALGQWRSVSLVHNGEATALPGAADAVRAVAFSPDSKRLAAAGGLPGRKGEVLIFDLAEPGEPARITGHSDCIYSVAFSPDGKLIATSSYDKLVKLWDASSGREVRTLKDHIDAVYALAFTPDGSRLVSGAADRSIKVWDVATGERLYTMSEPLDGINAVAVDPTGKMVAAGGLDKTIRIWALEPKSGRLLRSQIAHEDAITKLAWSPDGSMLVSASSDHTIKLFKASDLSEIKTIPNQPDWVNGLEFSPDGKTFTAGRYDGSMTTYEAR